MTGVLTIERMKAAATALQDRTFIVQDLLRTASVNILIGDSGLGKTPLGIQLGLTVATGTPFLGYPTTKGSVLYCDAESSLRDFYETTTTLMRFLHIDSPPADFYAWSPVWDEGVDSLKGGTLLFERVTEVRPSLVIVDAYRTFWPLHESKPELTTKLIREMRSLSKQTGTTWLITHHRRKVGRDSVTPDLETHPQLWMQEAAGTLALVNHTDTRLGIIPGSGRVDLHLGGFVRGTGTLSFLNIDRSTDEEGSPVGYRLVQGTDALNTTDQLTLTKLPPAPTIFGHKDVVQAMGGKSKSNATRFLTVAMRAGLVCKTDRGQYVRTDGLNGLSH